MKTHIILILDSSGSMEAIKNDTIGGFNSFLDDQKNEEGTATVSLYHFDTHVECLFEARPLERASRLSEDAYAPGGQTALYDAIAMASINASDRISGLSPAEKPAHVVVVILTDGKENASETSRKCIRDIIEKRQTERDWEYLFIGANQDAVLTASEMGVEKERALNMDYSGEGTQAAYESMSENISEARRRGKTGGFDEADRRRQDDAGEER